MKSLQFTISYTGRVTTLTKLEFIRRLSEELAGIPKDELEERLEFYIEMIDDRIDEGQTEEDAVADIGNVNEIISQILSEIPLSKIIKEKVKPKKKMKGWEITLIILGFPVWFPVLISVAAIIFSLYISLWSVIVSFWAVFASFSACSVAGLIAGIGIMLYSKIYIGLAVLSSGIVLAGLAIFTFFGCKAVTELTVKLTKKFVLWLKYRFARKEIA